MKNSLTAALLLSILSAFLLAAAMPNEVFAYGSPSIALFALAPLFAAFRLTKSYRGAAAAGVLFAAVTSVAQFFWLLYFEDFSVWTLSGVALGHMLYFLFFAPVLLVLSQSPSRLRPFLLAAAWTIYEYFRALGFLGFPWNMIAHPFGGVLPLAQIASLAGMWPVTFIAVLFSALAAELPFLSTAAAMRRFFRTTAAAVSILALFLVSGSLLLNAREERMRSLDTLPLLLVQTNVDFWRPGEALRGIARGQELTRAGLEAHPDTRLVVWSENSLQYPYEPSSSFYRTRPQGDPFTAFLAETGVPLLTGAPHFLDEENGEAMNSAFIISPDGSRGAVYGKSHLVPFAEQVPFWEFAPLRSFLQNRVGLSSAGWTPGDTSLLLHPEPGTAVGTPICFEDCFPYLTRHQANLGARLFINLTNDSWSKTIAGETQHFAAARFRSVETGRSLARATNAGVTCLILPTGETQALLPLYEAGSLAVSAPLEEPGYRTFYMIAGDWFAQFLFIILTVWRIADLRKKKRSGRLAAERFS